MGIRPLGTLAPPLGGDAWDGSALDLTHVMPVELRSLVAAYLEDSPVIHAWMGYSTDVIGGRFEVPGGNAISSDGVFYWRYDAANYVREYGIDIPEEALAHFQKRQWKPPIFTRDELIEVHDRLTELLEYRWD